VSAHVGRSVLVDITCVDKVGNEVDTFQAYGHVEVADERWIGIKRAGWSELFGLPPVPELLEPAAPGVYTLRATGEQIEDPDFLVTLEIRVLDAESLLALRGIGFVPA
jgi:hypothetical protein